MFHSLRLLLRTRWRTGLACSTVVHLALVALVGAELWLLQRPGIASPVAGVVIEAPHIEEGSESSLVDFETGPSAAWMARSSVDLRDVIETVDDPRWNDALLEAHNLPSTTPHSSDFISGQLLAAIAAADQRTEQANRQHLEALSDQLATHSSTESVDQLTASLQRWLGTKERATQPSAEPVDGEFDLETAQLHDVLRDDSAGEVRYTAVLLDAAGRTMESPLTQAEGESVYRVMQLMKENPLLERVYRGIVLSFLDKLVKQQAQ